VPYRLIQAHVPDDHPIDHAVPGRRGVLHRADVHEVDLGDGVVIPVLPPSARVLE
jgi:hypothetical protein